MSEVTIPNLPAGTLTLTSLLEGSNNPGSFRLAVSDFSPFYQLTSEKNATNGYAGLDSLALLLLNNFPDGDALQVLRRNAANDALEFAPETAGITSINTDTSTAQIIDGGTGISVSDVGDTHTVAITSLVATMSDTLDFFSLTTSLELISKISNPSGSGLLVFNNTPELLIPIIASFASANHNHTSGAGGGVLLSTNLSDTGNIAYLNTINSYTAGLRQSFLGLLGGTPGINVGGVAGNPFTIINGDIWLNTSSNQLFAQINGSPVDLGAGSTGEIFTWSADHSMASFKLTASAGNNVILNAPTGQGVSIEVAASQAYLFNSTQADFTTKNLVNVGDLTLSKTGSSRIISLQRDETLGDDVTIGQIEFKALDGDLSLDDYVRLQAIMESDVSGSENGSLHIRVATAGTFNTEYMNFNDASSGVINILETTSFETNDITNVGDLTLSKTGSIRKIILERDEILNDEDIIGQIHFTSQDGGNTLRHFVRLDGVVESDVPASEDGSFHIIVAEAGNFTVEYMNFNDASSGLIKNLKTTSFETNDIIGVGNLTLSKTGSIRILTLERFENLVGTAIIGKINFLSLNSSLVTTNYVQLDGIVESDIDGSEDGSFKIRVTEAGSLNVEFMSFNDASSGVIKNLKTTSFEGNPLINVDFFESNATNPAIDGTIRLGNNQTIEWRNSSNTNEDNIRFSSSDAFTIEINSVDQYAFSLTEADFKTNDIINLGSLGFQNATLLTLDSNGDITVTQTYHTLDTFGGASSDDLNKIHGASEGQILVIRTVTNGRDITVKDSPSPFFFPDNIAADGDFIMQNNNQTMILIFNGTTWLEISRSNNTIS